MPVVFINFFGIFPRQLPKRMEREDANLPSLQLWRKSCNKRALEASSWTIEWQMSWGKRLEPCVQSFSEERGKVEVLVPRGSLTNDAPKLVLSGYFITSWIITLLKASVRFATLSVAVTTTGWKFLVFVLVFFLNKTPVEKTSSEYRFGTLLSLAAVMFTSVNCH